jgi:hypothetical protein
MIDVIIYKILGDKDFVDVLEWCDIQFGPGAWPHIDGICKKKLWAVCSLQGKTLFRFYNFNDATLFKLRWL